MEDPKSTAYYEPPETPAPVFAMRAFKHAVFGTPQTQEAKPRRHSNTENARPRLNDAKPPRPPMVRSKSWHDSRALANDDNDDDDEDADDASTKAIAELEPLPSPTKGILLTPGSAAAKRKTVSFGDQVVDNENKRPMRSDNIGEGPERGSNNIAKHSVQFENAEPPSKPYGRSRLNEALEHARTDSVKRKGKSEKQAKWKEEAEFTADFADPRSDSGKYWKQEYDIYRENTTREVRKLVAKQKAAKNFARDKDIQCTQLGEQLREEQKKVARLEQRTAELEAQLKELRETLRKDEEEASPIEKGGQLRIQSTSEVNRLATRHTEEVDSSRQEKQERPRQLRQVRSKPMLQSRQPDPVALEVRNQPTGVRETPNTLDDIILDPNPSTKDVSNSRNNPQTKARENIKPNSTRQSPLRSSTGSPSPKASRATTTSTETTHPLQPLNINSIAQQTRSLALSMGLQPPSPQLEDRPDSPMRSPQVDHQLQLSQEPPIKASEQTIFPSERSAYPVSVPTQTTTAELKPPPANNHLGASIAARSAALRSSTQARDAKENVAPVQSSAYKTYDSRHDENVKPLATTASESAAAIDPNAAAGTESKRVTSRGGRQVSAERLAAARARIIARGRQVS